MKEIVVFVSTPFRGPDRDANVRFVKDLCRRIEIVGATTFAPHLLYPRFLEDEVPDERDAGIRSGLAIMRRACTEGVFALPKWRSPNFSDGMKKERGEWAALDRPTYSLLNESEIVSYLLQLKERLHG